MPFLSFSGITKHFDIKTEAALKKFASGILTVNKRRALSSKNEFE